MHHICCIMSIWLRKWIIPYSYQKHNLLFIHDESLTCGSNTRSHVTERKGSGQHFGVNNDFSFVEISEITRRYILSILK